MIAILLAVALQASAEVKPAAPVSTQLEWRVHTFGSVFWIIDQLSRWEPREIDEEFEREWAPVLALTPADRELLARYAAVRRRASPPPPEIPGHALGDQVVSPALFPSARFQLAFLRAGALAPALAALALRGEDAKTLQEVFTRFAPPLTARLEAMPAFAQTLEGLKKQAAQHGLQPFVARMARFYGVAKAPPRLVINLVWSPPGHRRSTCIGEQMVISIGAAGDLEERSQIETLGVIVHEFGHTLVSLLPDEQRYRLSDLLHHKYGLVQRNHSNFIDEAIHTALGNAHFVRTAQKGVLSDAFLYDLEPNNEWPDAIESTARMLEPLVAAHLDHAGAYSETLIPAALEFQRSVMGDRPRFHTRVGWGWAEQKSLWTAFKGQFWGASRSGNVGSTDRFLADEKGSPSSARWILTTLAGLAADAPGAPLAQRDSVVAAQKALERDPKTSACLVAVRTGPDAEADYELAWVGRSEEAVRALVVASHRAERMPTPQSPLCIGGAAP